MVGMERDQRSLQETVLRQGMWVSFASFVNNFSGFVYWLAVSALGGAEFLGYASTAVGLSSMLVGLGSLGVEVGVQKFVGEALGRGDTDTLTEYAWSSFFFALTAYLGVAVTAWALSAACPSLLGLPSDIVMVASILTVLSAGTVLGGALAASLHAHVMTLSALVGNVARLTVGLSLLVLGMGWVGVALGYAVNSAVALVVYVAYVLSRFGARFHLSLKAVRDVLRAGVVSWLPNAIVLTGQWLSLLVVFGSGGAFEAGSYYVAFMISLFVVSLASSSSMLLLPVLSGMADGRKRACDAVLRLGLLVTAPLALALAAYPKAPLRLLGEEYVGASRTLTILLASSLLAVYVMAVTSLAYAYDSYGAVLGIGTATSVPRIALYFLLVPSMGGLGAALAFLAGSVCGAASGALYAWRVGFRTPYRGIAATVLVPAAIGAVTVMLSLPWFVGIPLVVASSYLAYARAGLLSRRDAGVLFRALIPLPLRRYMRPIAELAARLVFEQR